MTTSSAQFQEAPTYIVTINYLGDQPGPKPAILTSKPQSRLYSSSAKLLPAQSYGSGLTTRNTFPPPCLSKETRPFGSRATCLQVKGHIVVNLHQRVENQWS